MSEVAKIDVYDSIEEIKPNNFVDKNAEGEIRGLAPFFKKYMPKQNLGMSEIADDIRGIKDQLKGLSDAVAEVREALNPQNPDFALINRSMQEELEKGIKNY